MCSDEYEVTLTRRSLIFLSFCCALQAGKMAIGETFLEESWSDSVQRYQGRADIHAMFSASSIILMGFLSENTAVVCQLRLAERWRYPPCRSPSRHFPNALGTAPSGQL